LVSPCGLGVRQGLIAKVEKNENFIAIVRAQNLLSA
jgi:hypothetical protein